MYLYPSSAEQNDHVCLVGAQTLNVFLTAAAATRAACHLVSVLSSVSLTLSKSTFLSKTQR